MLLALAGLWGASFMFIKIGVRELEPTTLVCVRLGVGALTAASLALLPFAIVQLPAHFPSWKVTGALLALSIGGTSVGYVVYYALLSGAGASRSILITYLVPALALAYGSLFLGEPVRVAAVAGLALVLAGVALGSGVLRFTRGQEQATQVGG